MIIILETSGHLYPLKSTLFRLSKEKSRPASAPAFSPDITSLGDILTGKAEKVWSILLSFENREDQMNDMVHGHDIEER
ncbi:MAG: hypothetical protein MPW15_12415 [Candidatus Manganitrophus sp.]|nr:hypothetical protein [Candidatus Manganitrophus sp.]